ncbi:MAG: hypothetical protein ACN4E2_06110 [Nitrospinota bacterium]
MSYQHYFFLIVALAGYSTILDYKSSSGKSLQRGEYLFTKFKEVLINKRLLNVIAK